MSLRGCPPGFSAGKWQLQNELKDTSGVTQTGPLKPKTKQPNSRTCVVLPVPSCCYLAPTALHQFNDDETLPIRFLATNDFNPSCGATLLSVVCRLASVRPTAEQTPASRISKPFWQHLESSAAGWRSTCGSSKAKRTSCAMSWSLRPRRISFRVFPLFEKKKDSFPGSGLFPAKLHCSIGVRLGHLLDATLSRQRIGHVCS